LAREVAPQNQYVARLAFVLAVLTDSLSLPKSVALAMMPGPLSLAGEYFRAYATGWAVDYPAFWQRKSGPLKIERAAFSSVLALYQAYQRLLDRLDDCRCCWKQSEQ